jgi:hypothetical protein
LIALSRKNLSLKDINGDHHGSFANYAKRRENPLSLSPSVRTLEFQWRQSGYSSLFELITDLCWESA